MAQFHDSDWWRSELKRMLEEQQPEDLHLDYKDKRSLLPPGRGGSGMDKQKRADDVSKDISSFLNSDGGVLIYGVPETDDPNATGGTPAAPLPVDSCSPDKIGFERGEITKETIENLITSNIQPKPGPDVFQIVEVKLDDRIFFIVEVEVGIGDVWQARDKRYYKRFHYKAEAMEHYEVNMVRGRDTSPNLKLVFGLSDRWEKKGPPYVTGDIDGNDTVYIGMQNSGNAIVESALIELGIFEGLSASRYSGDEHRREISRFRSAGYHTIKMGTEVGAYWYDLYWPFEGLHKPIFGTLEPLYISQFDLGIVENQHYRGRLFWRIQAPGMTPKTGMVVISAGTWTGISLEEGDGDFEIVDEA